MSGKRGRLWWYLRLRRAYRKHGVLADGYSRRRTWSDAMYSRRAMPVERQRELRKIVTARIGYRVWVRVAGRWRGFP